MQTYIPLKPAHEKKYYIGPPQPTRVKGEELTTGLAATNTNHG